MSINACDINVSMLLSLLLANFFFLVIFNNLFVSPVATEKNKVRLALAIATGAPAIFVNEIIGTPTLVALKTIN